MRSHTPGRDVRILASPLGDVSNRFTGGGAYFSARTDGLQRNTRFNLCTQMSLTRPEQKIFSFLLPETHLLGRPVT